MLGKKPRNLGFLPTRFLFSCVAMSTPDHCPSDSLSMPMFGGFSFAEANCCIYLSFGDLLANLEHLVCDAPFWKTRIGAHQRTNCKNEVGLTVLTDDIINI